MKFRCPHCESPGISALQKLFLSPRAPAICSNCEKSSLVCANLAFRSVLPLIAGILISLVLPRSWGAAHAWMLGLALYLYRYLRRVPLIPAP